jgi:uncharacterized protein (DUF305 family)
MLKTLKTLAACAACAALAMPAIAQDHSAHADSADLPAACSAGSSGGGMAMEGGMGMDGMGAMAMPSQAHEELMAGMDEMNRDMMAGGMAPEFDVAFVCSMIPHHRGAISMAKAALEHATDPQVKAWAEEIVAAQEKEIAEMTAWLEARG